MAQDNTESFIKKAICKHGSLYDYSEVDYIKSAKPVRIGCKVHNNYFMQSPNAHLNGQGCPLCGKWDSIGGLLQKSLDFSEFFRVANNKTYSPAAHGKVF